MRKLVRSLTPDNIVSIGLALLEGADFVADPASAIEETLAPDPLDDVEDGPKQTPRPRRSRARAGLLHRLFGRRPTRV